MEPTESTEDVRLGDGLPALGLNDDWGEPEFALEIDVDLSECEPTPTGEA